VTILAWGLAACGGQPRPPAADAAPVPGASPLAGRVVPLETVEVASLVTGLVVEVSCDEGQAVHAGQRCARIDAQPFEAAVQREQAQLRAARAREGRDREALAYGAAVLARARELLPDGVVSQEAVEAAQDAQSQARAQLEIDSAETARAQATLRAARLDLARADIVVPIDGVLVERRVSAGQAIVAALQAPTLFVVASGAGRLGVEIALACGGDPPPPVGTPARVAIDGLAGGVLDGRVRRLGGQGCEPGGGGRIVSIGVSDPQHRLVPGMLAHVTFQSAPESH